MRFRIDGYLQTRLTFHGRFWPPIKNRLKIMANIDIAEGRHPQDGRFSYPFHGQTVDCRLSCHPLYEDENLVLRLLAKNHSELSLDQLRFQPHQLEYLHKIAKIPEGLILFTGPTGSGKTTSLFAILSSMNGPSVNIMTLECQ